VLAAYVHGDCRMLHVCNEDDGTGRSQNCDEQLPPEPLNKTEPLYETASAQLREYCPHFYEDTEGTRVVKKNKQLICKYVFTFQTQRFAVTTNKLS
jgi:hypothetical protein